MHTGPLRLRSTAVVAIVAALAAFAASPGAPARAGDRTVADHRDRCLSTKDGCARAVSLDRLVRDGSSDAVAALESLADAGDERAAIHALAAVGRSDHSGARTKLRAVFENTRRPDVVRAAAFAAYARAELRAGTAWSALESYAGRHCGSGSRLASMVAATRSASSGSR